MLRATLKSLLSRKLRLVLSGFAIILGVMFVASAFVLTDSLGGRFEQLFQTINKDVAVQVQVTDAAGEDPNPPLLTDADLGRLAAVDGVRAVVGDASSEGLTPFRKEDGKALPPGAPHLGVGLGADDFVADGLLQVVEGRAAQTDNEVTLTRYTAEQTGHQIGERIKIYVPRSASSSEWTVVGLLEYSGGRATLGGETMIGFTVPEAQRLFYGRTGVFGAAQLQADSGVSHQTLKERVGTAVPTGFEAITGEEAAEQQASALKQLLTFVNWFFLGFALIALLVGMFLIFNTFNIIIAQRSRELALLRALGASWGQVTGSVLVEAVVVGLIASTLGLAAGIGVAAGLQSLVAAFGFPLPEGGLTISGLAVGVSYLVGVVMTVIAALVPAVRAAGVPPIAAMREVVRPDKSLRGLTITGGVITLISALLLTVGLVGVDGLTAIALGVGVLLAVVGVALLSPALTRPWPHARPAGELGTATGIGRRNTLRNPRRTAVTAAALMVGVTLVSAVSVIGASLKASVTDLVENNLSAAVIVTTTLVAPPSGREGFDPARLEQASRIPGVTRTVSMHAAVVTVGGQANSFLQATDLPAARAMFALEEQSGTLTPTGENDAVVDDGTAETNGWRVGSTFVVEMPVGGARTYTVAGIYQRTPVASGVLVSDSQVRYLAGPLALQGFVQVSDGADVSAVTRQIETLMSDYPLVSVVDQATFIGQQTAAVDQLLAIFYVLLALAVLVAFLGIVNTLVLSIYERTRELGLLRAVGMNRRQVRRMVRVESLLMAVFGCLLGVGLGVALGVTVTEVMRNAEAITMVALPYGQLIGFVVAAALAGVVAAWWPAWRASRLNVLDAISYE